MANYSTNVSDKSKKKALRLLLLGCVGLHLFYVGRIGAGIIRFIIGSVTWMALVIMLQDGIPEAIPVTILMFLIFNVVDLVKLMLGKFKDNIGNYVRA